MLLPNTVKMSHSLRLLTLGRYLVSNVHSVHYERKVTASGSCREHCAHQPQLETPDARCRTALAGACAWHHENAAVHAGRLPTRPMLLTDPPPPKPTHTHTPHHVCGSIRTRTFIGVPGDHTADFHHALFHAWTAFAECEHSAHTSRPFAAAC